MTGNLLKGRRVSEINEMLGHPFLFNLPSLFMQCEARLRDSSVLARANFSLPLEVNCL